MVAIRKHEDYSEVLAERAAVHGLLLNGKAVEQHKNQNQYRNYTMSCGHAHDFKYIHANAGKVKCKTCTLEKHKNLAIAIGAEIIDHNPIKDDSDYKKYKLACGHTKIGTIHNLVDTCSECRGIELEAACRRNNVSIITGTSKYPHVGITHLSCGHSQTIKMQYLFNDEVPACRVCRYNKHKAEAQIAGLVLLDRTEDRASKSSQKYSKYLLPCGCEKLITPGNVRRNVWACDNHSSYWNKESVIYLLRCKHENFEWLKLGVTSLLDRRISDYALKENTIVDKVYSVTLSNMRIATLVEKRIHAKLKSKRVNPDTMRGYMKSGFTECYGLSITDVILQELTKEMEKHIGKQ